MLEVRALSTQGGVLERDAASEREAAFAALVDAQLAPSYRHATLILGDASDAEDVTHDALVAAWSAWHGLEDTTRLDGWFSRILLNRCRDRLRQRRRRPVAPLDHAADAHGGDDYAVTHDRDVLAAGFEALDADERIAVVLRFYADLSIEQIADRTGWRAGTVKSRLHRALRRMRTTLETAASSPEENR